MLENECDLKKVCPKSGAFRLLEIGGQKTTFFSTTSQLSGNFSGFISSERNMIYIIGKIQEVSYIVSKVHELWSTNGLKLYLHFTNPPKSSK